MSFLLFLLLLSFISLAVVLLERIPEGSFWLVDVIKGGGRRRDSAEGFERRKRLWKLAGDIATGLAFLFSVLAVVAEIRR